MSRIFHRLRHICRSAAALAVVAVTAPALHAQVPDLPAPLPDQDSNAAQYDGEEASEGVEYLTRGPLHEAFATPYAADPEPGIVVEAEPPAAIQEVPPDLKPEGDNVVWIAGYWSWDDERSDFIWISGLWRDMPPNTRWVSGYWAEVGGAYQWVAGFWTSDQHEELAYLPPPPESMEQGPSSPAPSDDHFYIPGLWVYESNDYAWRPGFWAPQQADWVWIPATYVWTPRGCIYREGYWDYEPTYRGVVFTPVYYSQPVYLQPRYRYRPRYIVDTNLPFLVHLFIGPRYRNYYYGNYYGAPYRNNYRPWAQYSRSTDHWHHDPLYSYYRTERRGQQNVLQWASERYTYFESHEQYRPAPTVQAQQRLLASITNTDADATVQRLARVAADIQEVASQQDPTFRFERLSGAQQTRFGELMESQELTARQRLQFEARAEAAGDAGAAGAGQARAGESLRLPRWLDGRQGDPDRAGRRDGRDRDFTQGRPDQSDADARRDAARADRDRDFGDRTPGDGTPAEQAQRRAREAMRAAGQADPRGDAAPGAGDRSPAEQAQQRVRDALRAAGQADPRGDAAPGAGDRSPAEQAQQRAREALRAAGQGDPRGNAVPGAGDRSPAEQAQQRVREALRAAGQADPRGDAAPGAGDRSPAEQAQQRVRDALRSSQQDPRQPDPRRGADDLRQPFDRSGVNPVPERNSRNRDAQGNRSDDFPQMRRPFGERSSTIPGIPGLDASQARPAERGNRGARQQDRLPSGIPGLDNSRNPQSNRGNRPAAVDPVRGPERTQPADRGRGADANRGGGSERSRGNGKDKNKD